MITGQPKRESCDFSFPLKIKKSIFAHFCKFSREKTSFTPTFIVFFMPACSCSRKRSYNFSRVNIFLFQWWTAFSCFARENCRNCWISVNVHGHLLFNVHFFEFFHGQFLIFTDTFVIFFIGGKKDTWKKTLICNNQKIMGPVLLSIFCHLLSFLAAFFSSMT